MLARYKIYRGRRPPDDPLPEGVRQDKRAGLRFNWVRRAAVRRGITGGIVLGHARQLEKASGATQVLIVFDLFQKIDLRGDAAEGLAKDQQRLDVLQQVQRYSSEPGRPHGYPIL